MFGAGARVSMCSGLSPRHKWRFPASAVDLNVPIAATSCNNVKSEKSHWNHKFADAPLTRTLTSEGAASSCELFAIATLVSKHCLDLMPILTHGGNDLHAWRRSGVPAPRAGIIRPLIRCRRRAGDRYNSVCGERMPIWRQKDVRPRHNAYPGAR